MRENPLTSYTSLRANSYLISFILFFNTYQDIQLKITAYTTIQLKLKKKFR